MNNKIKLAVAGSVLALSATANAGIIIPAGEWTLDINGNVNAFASRTSTDKLPTVGGSPVAILGGLAAADDLNGEDTAYSINTGLLPAWLGFTGTTRQNDIDVSFTISMQPNVSDNTEVGDSAGDTKGGYTGPLWRQAFVTFGDKSWGTVKLGKDLGVFAGQAILNDMTLLGVGGGAGVSGAATTLGGIGSGYIYPAWKGQIAYTTPNMNGFSATIAITNPNQGYGHGYVADVNVPVTGDSDTVAAELYQDRFGIEAQAMYEWTGEVAGKVWASGATYDVTADGNNLGLLQSDQTTSATVDSFTASVFDIGATVSMGNATFTGYYYNGDGVGTTLFGNLGAAWDSTNAKFNKRDSDGGYLQATYVIPTGTKLGIAYGVSNLDEASGENANNASGAQYAGVDLYLLEKTERWTVGAYHPLTKHLNLVAEYNRIDSEAHKSGVDMDSDTVSLGAILFF
jgi:hypothetical protein